MAFDENALPPIPYKTPVIGPNGFITEPWSKFIRQLYVRVGGSIALTNIELEELQEAELVTILADINALEALTASHTTSISSTNLNLAELASDIENRGNFR